MIDINIKSNRAQGDSSDSGGSNGHSSPISGTDNEEQKSVKKELKETTKHLEKLGIAEKKVEMAEKVAGGNVAISQVPLTTNVYGVCLPPIPVFRYDITITLFTSKRELELTKQSRDDYRATDRKFKCLQVFEAIRSDPVFGGTDNELFYDGQKIMYSLKKLDTAASKGVPMHKVITLSGREVLAAGIEMSDVQKVEFKIITVVGESDFTLNDIPSVVSGDLIHRQDQTLLQFVNIATSQYALFNPDRHVVFGSGVSYLKKPWEEGFLEQDCPQLSEGKYVSVGAHKSAGLVEGPAGRGYCNVAITVDTAKTAFHCRQTVIAKAFEILPLFEGGPVTQIQIMKLRSQLKGLYAATRINGACKSIFQISNVTMQSSREKSFSYEDTTVTVEQYYKQKYQITLKYPQAPLLAGGKSGTQTNYFPMELSFILADQRVQKQQQTAKQLKDMRQACIIAPVKRQQQINMNMKALKLMNAENPWIAKVGIRMIADPLICNGRILPAPMIAYNASTTTHVDQNKMCWVLGQNLFVNAVKISSWAAYVVNGNGNGSMSEREFREFLKKFMKEGQLRGMRIADPLDYNCIPATYEDINKTIEIAAHERCEFILFVQSDSSSLHDAIKDAERRYEVVTQDVKMSTAMDVVRKNKWQTMENIVSKANIKLGGLNHGIVTTTPRSERWFHVGRLFIGLSMSHSDSSNPKRLSHSVVGYAANQGSSPFEFSGDFGFQLSGRTDNIDILSDFIREIITRCEKRRGLHPTELIIYRSGISEGQFPVVLQYEAPLIRAAAREAGCQAVKLTYIVANRLHNVRLMPTNVNPRDRVPDQNIKPGTVIDTELVHPRFSEFYLNSHRALQGTAKTPRYTVLIDDNTFGMDELEGMTFALCFCHQIVTITTSLPTPLYVASQYADRGRRILALRNGGSETSSDGSSEAKYLNLEAANDQLPYRGTKLAGLRINA